MDIHFRASLQLSHETGTLIYQMFSLRILGIAHFSQGILKQSREFYPENLSLSERVIWIENKWVIYDVLTIILGMAWITSELGRAN